MRKLFLTTLAVFFLVVLGFSFQNLESKPGSDQPQQMVPTEFPQEITLMLENSCYDCHISESSNLKAKGKLNFSKWDDMSDAKKVGKLESIAEELKEGKMPPSRHLKKKPEAALSKEQIEAFVKWTGEETNKLMGE